MSEARRIDRNSSLRWLIIAAAASAAIFLALQRGDPVTELHGAARVLDGDTLIVADRKIRLLGLDAPEYDQVCHDSLGESWACGTAARQGLSELVGGRAVDCAGSRHDNYGRLLAVCHAGEIDFGSELVRLGLAVARDGYALEQADAQSAGRGIWAGEFDDPEDWRRKSGGQSDGLGLIDWILGLFSS